MVVQQGPTILNKNVAQVNIFFLHSQKLYYNIKLLQMNNFSNNASHVTFMKTNDNKVAPTHNIAMTINKTIVKKKQGNEQPSIIKLNSNNYDEEHIRNMLANS